MTQSLAGHILDGSHVALEPLETGHAPALFAATDPTCLAYHPVRPNEWSMQGFAHSISGMLAEANRASYVVRWKHDGSIVGTSSFLDIRQAHRGVEIGATWITVSKRGTAANPEMKLLMMSLAFERWGAVRVQLKCDLRNTQSQRAIEKLGAVKEGVLRRHIVLPDGYIRDTVMYSVIEPEWPRVRDGLLARLSSFGVGGGVDERTQ